MCRCPSEGRLGLNRWREPGTEFREGMGGECSKAFGGCWEENGECSAGTRAVGRKGLGQWVELDPEEL